MSMFKRKKGAEPQFYATVADGLKKIYKGKLLPLEEVEWSPPTKQAVN